MKIPKVDRKIICSTCSGRKNMFIHDAASALFDHRFKPRLETTEEAYYCAGYSDGVRESSDKIHWGLGWD